MMEQGQPTNLISYPNRPPNRLPLAIVATVVGIGSVCMCFIGVVLGAIAIIFATQADSKYNREEYSRAESSSQVAYILSIVSLSISLISILFLLFLSAVGAIGDINDVPSAIDGKILDRLF